MSITRYIYNLFVSIKTPRKAGFYMRNKRKLGYSDMQGKIVEYASIE